MQSDFKIPSDFGELWRNSKGDCKKICWWSMIKNWLLEVLSYLESESRTLNEDVESRSTLVIKNQGKEVSNV